jgi:hypothetical protein
MLGGPRLKLAPCGPVCALRVLGFAGFGVFERIGAVGGDGGIP